jgi:predicted TIM-barrel fold metal-dependent hydrolase
MRPVLNTLLAVALLATDAGRAQSREPIIDMHVHAQSATAQGPPPMAMCTPLEPMPLWDQRTPYPAVFLDIVKHPRCADPIWSPMTDQELMTQTIAVMQRLNVIGMLGGTASTVDTWTASGGARFMPALALDVTDNNAPTLEAIRERHRAGRMAALAEVGNQYSGLVPDDARMEPYWALAEELDIPVGYHVGPTPPGAPYLAWPNVRARLHSPLTMEEVLVRHPKLRVWIMHAGYPMLDDLLALLYQHPQVHVDVGVIVYTQPRPAFYRFLQAIVDAGFIGRVMFGSDQMVWPATIERSIAVINEAPFLSAAQKRDILYNNAARFLRLSADVLARHKGM